MGLIERLFGRRRRESVDSWARRDDSSQYLYTPTDTAATSRDPDRDDDRDDADANDDNGGDSGDGGGGGGGNGGNGGGD